MKETLLLGHGSGDEAIGVTLDSNMGVAGVFFGLPPPVTFMIIVSVERRVKATKIALGTDRGEPRQRCHNRHRGEAGACVEYFVSTQRAASQPLLANVGGPFPVIVVCNAKISATKFAPSRAVSNR